MGGVDRGGDIEGAVAAPGARFASVDAGRVGGAELLAQVVGQLHLHHALEQLELERVVEVAVVLGRPAHPHDRLVRRAAVIDYPERTVGGERAHAVGRVIAELRLARGQGTESLRHQRDRLVGVDVADQRQLQRAVRQAVADRRLQPGEVEREIGFLRLQGEARIAVGDDPAEAVAERGIGRRVEAGEIVLDIAAVLRLALRAVAGIADRRGEQLQLQLEIARRGPGAHPERALAVADGEADAAPGEDRLQLVVGMFAEPADGQDIDHRGGERLLLRIEHLPAVDIERDEDAVLLQRGRLEVELEAVGENDLTNAE